MIYNFENISILKDWTFYINTYKSFYMKNSYATFNILLQTKFSKLEI